MSMTRKHFESIAETIKTEREQWTGDGRHAIDWLARGLASDFENLNDNFDPERFYTACGMDSDAASVLSDSK